ncbi:MAG: DNA recombination protein RmuC, partial [Massilia sp.]
MSTLEFIVLAVALLAVLGLQVVLLSRARRGGDERHAFERLERELRQELQTSAQSTRQELAAHLAQNQAATVQQLDGMRQQIQLNSQGGREEQARALKRFSDTLNGALANLTESNAQRMLEIRATLEAKIRDLQSDNAKRLEEMRQTVDEKLHATLETRLTESFRQVSDRLEKVHQGLGEMQQLAVGVGDLKRVLVNVK